MAYGRAALAAYLGVLRTPSGRSTATPTICVTTGPARLLAIATGLAAFLAIGLALGPYPELLGQEGARLGVVRWHWELIKPFVPLAIGVFVGITLFRTLTQRAAQ